jgi:uncharacterized membrane protein
MSAQSRATALLAYLVPLAGPLVVLGTHREDAFARYHAGQALAAHAVMAAAPLSWLVVSWGLAWVPRVGPLLVVVLFALVLAALVLMLAALIAGAANALRGQMHPIPLVGERAERRMGGGAPAAPPPEPIVEASGPMT